jgi:hypothetical protein
VSANDGSGLSDEVHAELNPTGSDPDRGPQADPIPERPAASADKAAWVDYVVALGADRTFVTEDTEHFDGVEYGIEPGFTRQQLIDLADRLGG